MINRKRKLLPVLAAVSLMLAGLSGCGGHAEPPLEAAALRLRWMRAAVRDAEGILARRFPEE